MAENHAHFRTQSHKDAQARVKRAGGGHTDVSEDKKLIKKAFRQHENAEHGGKHSPLKLLKGGAAEGHKSKHAGRKARAAGGRTMKTDESVEPTGARGKGGREVDPKAESEAKSDKHGGGRFTMAAGGAAKKKSGGSKGHHTTVNVISPPPAPPHPMMPPGGGLGMPPPHPPMAPPPGAGAMPPPGGGAMPPRPPVMPPGGGAPPIGAGAPGMGMMRAKGGRVHLTGGGKGGEARLEKIKAYGDASEKGEGPGGTEDFEDKGDTAPGERKKGGRT